MPHRCITTALHIECERVAPSHPQPLQKSSAPLHERHGAMELIGRPGQIRSKSLVLVVEGSRGHWLPHRQSGRRGGFWQHDPRTRHIRKWSHGGDKSRSQSLLFWVWFVQNSTVRSVGLSGTNFNSSSESDEEGPYLQLPRYWIWSTFYISPHLLQAHGLGHA